MVQDRSGKQLRRFHVEIDGDVVGDTLTSMSALSMTTARSSSGCGAFAAPAITVIRAPPGISKGWPAAAAGNAFHWRYSMSVEASGSRWLLHFDDWMFLQDGIHLFNKTEMKKFGITVATVTLFFTRTTAEERTAP